MSYNGSGTFQINTSGQPVVTGTSISSTVFNALTADLATGLSTAITKDGQTTTTARIPFALGINSTLVTDATNTTSGSIITAGGVGIAKALYVGTTANVAGVATLTSNPVLSGGTANGVAYLNGSKVLTTGSALVFDGTNFSTTGSATVKNLLLTGGTLPGAANPSIALRSSDNNIYFQSGSANQINFLDSAQNSMYVAAETAHIWNISNAEKMRIDSSGQFYLGTAGANTPSSTRPGTAWGFGSGSNNYWINAVNTTGTANHWSYVNGNGEVGKITTNGSATTYATSSDYRLKEAIAPMTGALEKVALLKPCTYKWKVDGSDGQGFIAHELAEVVPDCVTGEKDGVRNEQYEISPAVAATFDEDGNELTARVEAVMGERTFPSYQGVDVSFLVATLTAAIQEQQALITTLTDRITALEARNG